MMRARAWPAHLLAAVGIGSVAGSLVLTLSTAMGGGTAMPIDSYGPATIVTGAAFPIAGWIIATRRPGNAIGWIFLVIGVSQGLSGLSNAYFDWSASQATAPLMPLAAWLSNWVWAPGYVLMMTLAALLFPDGRPPSPRWGIVIALVLIALALIVLPGAVFSLQYLDTPDVDLTAQPGGSVVDLLSNVGMLLALVCAVLSIAGMLARYRRSHGVERRQLTWFTFAGAVELSYVAAIAFLPGLLPDLSLAWAVIGVVVAPLLPIAATVAILRYRLYEIDRIVSRTIGWTLTTGIVAAVFGVVVVGLQAVVEPVTGGSTLAVALSTLAAAALFQPVRRRVQAAVDRRFNRSRYDGQRTAAAFAARLRDEVDLAGVERDVAATVREALRPGSVAIWVRREGSA